MVAYLTPPQPPAAGATGARILVIDDEPQIQRAVRTRLEAANFAVVGALNARDGLTLVARRHPDLVILDLSLPDQDGLDVCRALRSWSPVPIIVLSVRAGDADKVTALESGADDYLTKPFSSAELVARVRVALRHAAHSSSARKCAAGPSARFQTGGLVMDFETRQVTVNDGEVHLTLTEFAVLKYLAENAGRVITHRTLLRAIWGPAYEEEDHYLYVFLGRLRRKLEPDPTRPRYLLTEPGVGYRLRSPEARS